MFHSEVIARPWKEVWPHVSDQKRQQARQRWQEWREKLGSVPVIDIDTVAQYFLVGTGQENWDLMRDFGDLRPPAQLGRAVWMEYGATHIVSEKYGVREFGSNPGACRVGSIHNLLEGVAIDTEQKDHDVLVLDSFFWFQAAITGAVNAPFSLERLTLDRETGKCLNEAGPFELIATDDPELSQLAVELARLLRPAYLALSYLADGKVRLEQTSENRYRCLWT